jgi:hypothetical protein
MFGFRRKALIHRDEAANVFMDHCRQEANKLLRSIIPPLRAFCEGKDGRPTFDAVMSPPFLSFDAGQFKSRPAEHGLAAAHCYAITTAIGLNALHRHIDPHDQADVMEWMVYKLIIEEDVGPQNVGTPQSPWQQTSDGLPMHVRHLPGTFEGGVPSQQKELLDRYSRLSPPQKLVILLMALKLFRPQHGVSKVLYQKTHIRSGIGALNRIGAVQPDPDDLDEWENHLEIEDADAALSATEGAWMILARKCRYVALALPVRGIKSAARPQAHPRFCPVRPPQGSRTI